MPRENVIADQLIRLRNVASSSTAAREARVGQAAPYPTLPLPLPGTAHGMLLMNVHPLWHDGRDLPTQNMPTIVHYHRVDARSAH